jgi:hypothetical protein
LSERDRGNESGKETDQRDRRRKIKERDRGGATEGRERGHKYTWGIEGYRRKETGKEDNETKERPRGNTYT